MSSKRKHVVLSLKEKAEIVEALTKGERGSNLARKYGVGTSTITDIRKKSNNIMRFYKSCLTKGGPVTRKVMRQPKYAKVDSSVYTWFVQQRLSGQSVTGTMLCAKALEINKEFNGDPNFKASNGWLENFKMRCGIKQTDMDGETFSMDASLDGPTEILDENIEELTDNDQVCSSQGLKVHFFLRLGFTWSVLNNNTL